MKAKIETAANRSKKFIGLRVAQDKAQQLQELADARGVSLNELLNGVIDELQDPQEVAVEQVDKGMNHQQDRADDLHKNVDRLQAFMRLQEQVAQERKRLEDEKPDGFVVLFDRARLEEWKAKAAALEEKYKRLGDKINAMLDQALDETDSADARQLAKAKNGAEKKPSHSRSAEDVAEPAGDESHESDEEPESSHRVARRKSPAQSKKGEKSEFIESITSW